MDSTIGRVLGESIAKESTGGLSKHFKGFNWGGLGKDAGELADKGFASAQAGAAQSPVADSEAAVLPFPSWRHITSPAGSANTPRRTSSCSKAGAASRSGMCSWQSDGRCSCGPSRYKAAWYDPRQSYANFVLTNSADTYGMDGGGPGVPASMISRGAIAALHAGPPAHVYHYKTFTILVWNHNLLPDLTGKPVVPSGVPCENDCI